jgi:WbqC-like protein family
MTVGEKTVVISQPMYFPWCGLLDQIRLANVYVHYDDVQLSRGFYNRVQVKTPQGTTMITVPLRKKHRDQKINESIISYESDWVSHHRSILLNSYRKAMYLDDAIDLFDSVHANRFETLSDLGKASIKALASYFKLGDGVFFLDSSSLDIKGASSQRLLDITKALGGSRYLTGHGALKYLNHDLFEQNDVEVRYMNYSLQEYQQVFGTYTPYVSALDTVAHLGPEAKSILQSTHLNWRNAIERPEELRSGI